MQRELDRITITGKGKLEVKVGGRTVVIGEGGAPRGEIDNGKVKTREKQRDFPEGTLDSLRPLLRQVFDNGFDEEAYWARVVDIASMDPQEAVNKLRAAGFGIRKVARELVVSDKQGFENRSWGRLSKKQIKDKVSQVARILRPYYRYEK